MQKYIQNLIPRLRAFGKQLNKVEEFVDKTWVLEDNSGIITYRFKRNGLLRKTINGDIKDSQWELEGTDAISIIDHVSKRGEMFRHGFVLDGLLIVQKEGTRSKPIIFYNESVVSDGDVESYLSKIFISKENLKKVNDSKGYYYKGEQYSGSITVGSEVFNKDFSPVIQDNISIDNKTICIENGKIKSIKYSHKLNSDKGFVYFSSISDLRILQQGDEVVVNSNSFFTGVLKLTSGKTIKVKDGIVTSTFFYKELKNGLLIATLLILFIFFGLYQLYNSNKNNESNIGKDVVSIENAALIIDSAVVIADTARDPFEPGELKEQNMKEKIGDYFDMINQRDWRKVNTLFASTVNYFGTTTSISEIQLKLEKYWGSMSLKSKVWYETSNIKLSDNTNKSIGYINIIEEVEKGIYKIPYILITDMTFELNRYDKIISIQSKISANNPFFIKLFNLNTEISLEDYRLRNNESDWTSIFNTLQNIANNTPSVYGEYVNSVIDTYGINCYLEEGNSLISLNEYLRKLQRGESIFRSVIKVTGDENGKIIKVF